MTTWLDKAITWIAPGTGLRRIRSRAAAAALLGYEGANAGRRTAGWTTSGTSANAEVGGGLISLRARSRDLVRNSPYAARAIDEMTHQSIGTGISAQADTPSEGLSKQIDETWATWMEECDADGQLDFYGLQNLMVRTMLESGECLIRLRPRFSKDGFLVPLQLQIIEPDYLDLGKTAKLGGGYIIQGVEFDQLNRRVAYWIFPEHPGDVISTSRAGNTASRRIPATEIIHLYRKPRAGQVRGVPLLAPVILALRDLDEYQDAERVRKKIEACLTMFVAEPDSDAPTIGTPQAPEASGKRIEEFRPGMIQYGAPGQQATFFAPTGSGGYGEFCRQNERVIATGIGMTYEQLTGDLSTVNYSSYRAGLLSHQAGIESLRWLCIIPQALRPIRRRFIDVAYTAGAINEPVYATQWTPGAFGSVDPLKDAESAEMNLRTGRATWPQVVSEVGFDPRKQIEEIQKWKAILEKAGVSFAGPVTPSKVVPNEKAQQPVQ